jgi:hypothetical protein
MVKVTKESGKNVLNKMNMARADHTEKIFQVDFCMGSVIQASVYLDAAPLELDNARGVVATNMAVLWT